MHRKILFILHLRLKQLYRMLQDIGWILLAVFVLITFGMLFSIGHSVLKIQSWYAIPALFGVLLMIDYSRNDKPFLVSVFQNQKSLWLHFLIEYFIISLPVLIFQLILQNWLIAILSTVPILWVNGIALYLKKTETTFAKVSLAFIPLSFFEFKFFVESAWIACLLLWVIGICGVFHYALLLIFLFLVTFMVPAMLAYLEAREMIEYTHFFIWKKVLNMALPLTVYIALPAALTLWFHPDMVGVILYGISCMWVACFMSVVLKYGAYSPIRAKFEMSNMVSLLLMFMLLPGGVLITLFYTLFKYNTASKNLKSLYA
jgi:hypothetical protein